MAPQWPLTPAVEVIDDRVGELADQIARHIGLMHVCQVRLDLTAGQAFGIQRQDHLVKPRHPTRVLRDDLRLKAALPVTRNPQRNQPQIRVLPRLDLHNAQQAFVECFLEIVRRLPALREGRGTP
jgi:hypothetical protein